MGKNRGVLILAMSCNAPSNKMMVADWLPKWGKACEEYDNIEWLAYTSSDGKPNSIDWDSHIVYVNAKDGFNDTYEKTAQCFKYLYELGVLEKYDYIFRTNDTTWINVKLLKMFVDSLADNDGCVYGGTIHIRSDKKPFKFAPFIQGNGMLIKTSYIAYTTPEKHAEYQKMFNFISQNGIDDQIIGQCLCCMFMINGVNPWNMFKSFGRFTVCTKNIKNQLGDANPAGSGADNISQFIIVICKDFIHRVGDNPDESDIAMYEWTENAFKTCKMQDSLDLVNNCINEDKVYLSIPEYCDRLVPKEIAKNVLMLNPVFAMTYGQMK